MTIMTPAPPKTDPPVKKNAFVHKLYSMLCNPKLNHLIWWTDTPEANTFALYPSKEFADALSGYFKHGNVALFVRQLHMYGFHKVLDPRVMAVDKDNPVWEFRHLLGRFRKGDEKSLVHIKRRLLLNLNLLRNLVVEDTQATSMPSQYNYYGAYYGAQPMQQVQVQVQPMQPMHAVTMPRSYTAHVYPGQHVLNQHVPGQTVPIQPHLSVASPHVPGQHIISPQALNQHVTSQHMLSQHPLGQYAFSQVPGHYVTTQHPHGVPQPYVLPKQYVGHYATHMLPPPPPDHAYWQHAPVQPHSAEDNTAVRFRKPWDALVADRPRNPLLRFDPLAKPEEEHHGSGLNNEISAGAAAAAKNTDPANNTDINTGTTNRNTTGITSEVHTSKPGISAVNSTSTTNISSNSPVVVKTESSIVTHEISDSVKSTNENSASGPQEDSIPSHLVNSPLSMTPPPPPILPPLGHQDLPRLKLTLQTSLPCLPHRYPRKSTVSINKTVLDRLRPSLIELHYAHGNLPLASSSPGLESKFGSNLSISSATRSLPGSLPGSLPSSFSGNVSRSQPGSLPGPSTSSSLGKLLEPYASYPLSIFLSILSASSGRTSIGSVAYLDNSVCPHEKIPPQVRPIAGPVPIKEECPEIPTNDQVKESMDSSTTLHKAKVEYLLELSEDGRRTKRPRIET